MYINRRCEYNPAGQAPNSDMTPTNEFGWYRAYGGGHGRKRNFSVPRRATLQARPRFLGPFLKAPGSPSIACCIRCNHPSSVLCMLSRIVTLKPLGRKCAIRSYSLT